MNDISALQYANVDEHMSEAGSLHKAMLPLGFVTAFCFHHGLLSAQFVQQHESVLARVRYQEGQVSELFAANGAVLNKQDLNERGLVFLQSYLAKLTDDFKATFGADCYGIEDSWENYQLFAKVLVRAHLGAPKPHGLFGSPSSAQPIVQSIKSSWKKLWR